MKTTAITRRLALALCASSIVSAPAYAQAPAFPGKPIRIIIPAAAGGPTDAIGRLLGKLMSEQYNVPVVVENRAGASGSIGVHASLRSTRSCLSGT